MASDTIVDGIVNYLDSHEDSLRIKKLLFYACQGYWADDTTQLSSINTGDLLLQLSQYYPSIETVSEYIHQLVETLNRRDLYTYIGNLIISQLVQIYGDSEECTQMVAPQTNATVNINEETVYNIVDYIENHPERERMKKLIFSAANNYWENDINVIDSYDFREIILYFRQLQPTLEKMQSTLYKVVSTLNRPNLYSFITDTIIRQLECLYGEEGVTQIYTQIIKKQQLNQKLDSTSIVGEGKLGKLPEGESPVDSSRIATTNYSEISSNEQNLKEFNSFELRKDLMQYANPLRTKILLFYTIYQLDSQEQDWSIVRGCTLDDLLFRMFYTYKKLGDLEVQLRKTAESLNDPDEYIQVAGAIIKSIKRFFN